MTDTLQNSIDKTFLMLINDQYAAIKSTSNPNLHIVGGQPGSGKSAVKEILLEKDSNLMIIDGDEHRKHHPQYDLIKSESPDLMPQLTQKFSQALNEKLINHAVANNLPFAVETTFWSADATEKLVNPAKEKGYKAHLHVMAVNPEISRLYTISRFENGKQNGSIGRTNAKDIHDDRVNKNVPTLQKLDDNKVFDSISIYGRSIKGNQSITKLIDNQSNNTTQTLINERSRKFSPEESKFYAQQAQNILSLMEKRSESSKNINDFKKEFESFLKSENKVLTLAELAKDKGETKSKKI